MTQSTFTVPNISCGHCVNAIKNELAELDGVNSVDGDPESKTIVVDHDADVSRDRLMDLLKEINYPADINL